MTPVFLVHAGRNDETIRMALGRADYSYYFVLKEFQRVLQQLGIAITVDDCVEIDSNGRTVRTHDVAGQVDAVHEICRHRATPCLFLSFAPPPATPLGLACPTIPVFAWEFYDIPCESWDDEPRHDWRAVLRTVGAAITHSEFCGFRPAKRDPSARSARRNPLVQRFPREPRRVPAQSGRGRECAPPGRRDRRCPRARRPAR